MWLLAGVKVDKNSKLYGKTFSTPTGTRCIGVVEREALSFKAAGEFERRVEEIKETFEVSDHLHAVVFKHLIVGLGFVVEVHFITQPGTTAARDAHAHEVVVVNVLLLLDFLNLCFGAICYEKHGSIFLLQS